jgi:hypothetical protein
MHLLDGLDCHGLFHVLDGSCAQLVVGSLGDFDTEDEPEGLEHSLELCLGGLRRKTADNQTGVIMHVLLVPRLVVDLDFLAEELLVVHHLDGLESCLGRAVLNKSDSSGLFGDEVPLDLNLGDFAEVLEGLEEHSFVYLRR